MWSQHLEDVGDRASFLRMVNRNHIFNSSNYSLSSLFRYTIIYISYIKVNYIPCLSSNIFINFFIYSLGSVGGSVASGPASRPGSTRSRRPAVAQWQGPSCLAALYELLIAPFEDCLPCSVPKSSSNSSKANFYVYHNPDVF